MEISLAGVTFALIAIVIQLWRIGNILEKRNENNVSGSL